MTTDSKHLLPLVKNSLDRLFSCTQPNQVWVANITYIPTSEDWLGLSRNAVFGNFTLRNLLIIKSGDL